MGVEKEREKKVSNFERLMTEESKKWESERREVVGGKSLRDRFAACDEDSVSAYCSHL